MTIAMGIMVMFSTRGCTLSPECHVQDARMPCTFSPEWGVQFIPEYVGKILLGIEIGLRKEWC